MATNIEIKARVADLEGLRARAETISETRAELIQQEDVFFHTPTGRLKLRILAANRGQLIYYRRPNQAGPKRSDYFIHDTIAPDILRNVLGLALGIKGIVRKRRWLYWVGQTRIHLDEVEGLGSFMELEVVLAPGGSAEEGKQVADDLMARLGVEENDLIEGAYIDLLLNAST